MLRPARIAAIIVALGLALAGCGLEFPGMLREDPDAPSAAPSSSEPPRHTVAPPTPSSRHQPTTAPATETTAGSESSTSTSTVAPPPQVGTRVLTSGPVYFTSPSGRIVCAMDAEMVRCDFIAEAEWTAPPPPDCNITGGRALIVEDASRVLCAGDSLAGIARQGEAATSWYDPAKDTISNLGGQQQVALGYDQTLRLGDFECRSETKGVTCTNLLTGAGLFISRESYQLF